MERKKASDFPQDLLDLFHEHQHGYIDRRLFLHGAGRFAVGGLTVGAIFEMMRPNDVWAQPVAKETHAASARVLDLLRTRFTFQISVDVATLEQGRAVAGAALAGGVNIVEMGTPLLKNQGVSNVVPAFRQQFPEALLLADMKTMDGGAFEARAVYAGGGNIIDFLALAGADTAKAICAVRDEFRRAGPELPRLVFADILVPHQGPAAQAVEVALRMLEAGVDAVGVHLQSDARRADSRLIESDYLGDMAAPSSSASARPPRCRWSAGSASRRQKALPGRGCALSSSAAISASRTPAPATTCRQPRSSGTSPVSSPRSRAPRPFGSMDSTCFPKGVMPHSLWETQKSPDTREAATMKKTTDVRQGTLALMVLKTLDVLGPLHGYGLARRIEQISGDRLTLNMARSIRSS